MINYLIYNRFKNFQKNCLALLMCGSMLSCSTQTGPGGVGRTDGTSSLEGWYMGDLGIEEAPGDPAELGDPVVQWLDQSSNNNHMVTDGAFPPGFFSNGNGFNGLYFAIGANRKILVSPSPVSASMTDVSIFSAYVNSTSGNGNERPVGVSTNPAWVPRPTNGNNFSQGTDNSFRKDNGPFIAYGPRKHK
ncbi:MAG: hypothetical protein HRT57_01070 [Crocinitomicaceae bacterium]|nr:hypothetical protein [Crocinitomicaceae bacterium]